MFKEGEDESLVYQYVLKYDMDHSIYHYDIHGENHSILQEAGYQ